MVINDNEIKVLKKDWNEPEIVVLSSKETFGGLSSANKPEDDQYLELDPSEA